MDALQHEDLTSFVESFSRPPSPANALPPLPGPCPVLPGCFLNYSQRGLSPDGQCWTMYALALKSHLCKTVSSLAKWEY